jgi:hypothetical protein
MRMFVVCRDNTCIIAATPKHAKIESAKYTKSNPLGS